MTTLTRANVWSGGFKCEFSWWIQKTEYIVPAIDEDRVEMDTRHGSMGERLYHAMRGPLRRSLKRSFAYDSLGGSLYAS